MVLKSFCINHIRVTLIDVELPDVELDDGSKMSVLSVTFPDGQKIQPCCGDEGDEEPFILKCKVTFCSPRPVSFTQPVKFVDTEGNRLAMSSFPTKVILIFVQNLQSIKKRRPHKILSHRCINVYRCHSNINHRVRLFGFHGSTPVFPRCLRIALTSFQGLTRVSLQCPA